MGRVSLRLPQLIGVAVVRGLADFEHDLVFEKDAGGSIPNPQRSRLPLRVLGDVVHGRRSVQHHAGTVGPLVVVERSAVVPDIRTIVDVISRTEKTHAIHPVPDHIRVLRVGFVRRVGIQPRRQIQKPGIARRVLVVPSGIPLENLPSQSTITVRLVPARRLAVKHGLSLRRPTRLVGRRVGEFILCGAHDGESPKDLIVVALVFGLVLRHEVVRRTELEQERGGDFVVVLRVARVVPVVY